MDGNGDEPETIDVWELMKDLDDNDNFLNSKQHTAAPLSKKATASAKFSLDSLTSEPADVKKIPQWLSSYQTHSVHGRSFPSPAEGSSRDLPTYGKTRSKHASMSTSLTPEPLNVKLAGPTQETLAEHLQRSLSFESSSKNEMKRIFGQKDAMNAYYSKGLKLGFDKETLSFSSSQLPWQRESLSSPSTPSFSGSVSLKKLFQEDSRRLKHKHEHKAAPEAFGHESQSKLIPHQVSPPLVSTSKVLQAMNKVPGGSQNMFSYEERDVNVGTDYNSGSHHVVADQRPSVGLNQTRGVRVHQQSRVRRLRHSFTADNRNREPSEVRNFPANIRSSSLELEKVAGAPKVRLVLYSTSSKVDEQAFEDSNAARAILKSVVGAEIEERSVSQHPQYGQELKRALNTESAHVPTVCVKGRYITGLDSIMQMYKKGVLRSLVAEQELKPNAPCICRGGKFLICPVCKGKRKLARKEGDDEVPCHHCSATGLIMCPNCLNA